MRWLMSVLGSVLVLTGCSKAGNQAAPPPSPAPPPAGRALVAWAETTCTQVKQIDALRAKSGEPGNQQAPPSGMSSVLAGMQAESTIRDAAGSVNSVTKALRELAPTGIPAADAYAGELVKTLDGVRPQLPAADDAKLMAAPDEEKIAKAKQVSAVLAAIEAQGPKLAAMADGTPQLISSYNLAPSCVPGKKHDERARRLLVWSNVLCESTKSVLSLDTDPLADPGLTDPRFARLAESMLSEYPARWLPTVEQIARQLSSVSAIGIKDADEYRSALLATAQAALPKLPKREFGASRPGSQSIEQLKQQAAQVADTLRSIKPKGPELAAVAAADPQLSAAYGLAPACEPPKPAPSTALPTAANGTDLAACRSGKCQIQVSGSAEVTMSGFRFTISVTQSGVNVVDDLRMLRLGTHGQGSVGSGSKTVTFKVLGVNANTAVLDIGTS
ncbi:hypothetical protein [Amycolatopsis sp. NPDC059021]|uniref:hypothetical protein n=1 Tax=Amycolatopsis sp. NPDC059021 TaxID=3346704 RepID=UPI00366C2985